jgi:HAE1 family hydrophobic/amphiphilic exporter-1
VRVQADADYRRRLEDTSQLYVSNRAGQVVPLGAMIAPHRTLGSELITRYNLYPTASVTGVPMPRYSSGQAMEVMEQLGAETFPRGLEHEWSGLSYQERLVGNQAYLIFGLSITLVFLMLAAQYESWIDPAAVILTVPIALLAIVVFGGMLASTLLAIPFVPVFFIVVRRVGERLGIGSPAETHAVEATPG